MNFFDNFLFKSVTDGLKKRVFKFIFKRTFDRFIKEIDLSQVDIQLFTGVVELENLELKIDGINKFLRDVPFNLTGGYIRKIKVRVPWRNILKESLAIEVHGIEVQLEVKETQRTRNGSVSQLLADSFIGELARTADPNVLASSILIGDISKKDMSEFEAEQPMVASPQTEAPKQYEGEEYIAKIIEQVVSNIRATISDATVKIHFPSQQQYINNTNNVLLLHFPKLEYYDKTPKPSDNDQWSPSYFMYEFLMRGLVVQLLKEDSKMMYSTLGHDENKELDEGNTVLFGDTRDSHIQIHVHTGDQKNHFQSSIEIKFSVSSIHTCLKPSQLKMITEMMETLKIVMTSQQANQPPPAKSKAPIKVPIFNEEDDTFEPINTESPTLRDPNISQLVTSNLNMDDEFKDIDVNEDDEFVDAKSVESETSPVPSNLDHFSDPSSFPDPKPSGDASDVSLKATFHLKSGTCTILYEEANLTDMWREFFGRKEERDSGPKIPGEHLILSLSDVIIDSENNNTKNTVRLRIGSLKLTEKFKKHIISTFSKLPVKKSLLAVDYDHFEARKKSPTASFLPSPVPEMVEENILCFMPKQESNQKKLEKTPSPQLFVEFSIARKDGSVEVKGGFAPVIIKFNVGILARLQVIMQTFNQKSTFASQAKQMHLADLSRSLEEEILQVIDTEVSTVASTYNFKFDAISLAISFPKINQGVISKLEFNDEILLLHIDSLKVIKPAMKKNQSPDDVLILADIKSMSITLNNPKKNMSHTFVQIETTTINMTLRNKDKTFNENLDGESLMTQELKDKPNQDDTPASTPASESRSDDMFAENIETEVNNQKLMASAAASLIIDAQKMNVVLNKEQFDLIQKLINDLSVGVATATNPAPFSSQILNSQSPQTPMPLSSIDEDEDVGPDFAVQLLVRDICVTLNDLASPSLHPHASKHTLQLNLKEFMTMINMYQFAAPLIKVQVQAEDVNIHELFKNPDKKVPILRGFKKLVKEYRSNKSAFITSISYKKMPILAKILVKMQLNGLFLNFYQELPEDMWIMCLLSFITTTEQTDAQSITSVYVVMHDCVADYAPIHIPSRLVACLNRTMFATQIVTTAKDMSFNVTLEGASVHLHDKFQHDIIDYLDARPHESSEFGFVNDLKNLEFVQIASLNSLSICVKMTTSPTVDNPAMAIDISNGTVLVDTCADSFNTLRELLTYFANQQDIADKVALVTKWKLENAPKPDIPKMTTAPPPTNIKQPVAKPERPKKPSILMDSLDEDFFDKPPVASPPKGNAPSAVKSAPKKINLNTFVVEDHFPASTSADAGLKRDLPKDYPVPEFEVIINDKVEVVITMYGGCDWGELASKHNKSSSALIKKTTLRSNRDVTRMIECKVADIFVQFTLCKISDPIAWRARVSVKDFEVIDKIKKSTRHKIASYMKNSDKPREFNSRMLDFVFESVRPNYGINDAQEFKMRLDVLPVRINIHEEALIFLLEFLDVPNPFKSQEATTTTPSPAKTPSAQQEDQIMKFKSVEISPIHLKIDYEPSKLEYGQIAKGNFVALINVAQIKGLEVSLSGVQLKNVQGVDSFVQQTTQVYMNDVMGTQLFRFLLGFMPVRAVYNVGSGVYDLIAIPIDQYNRDGSLLRGFRRGVASCVSGIAQGTAGITAVAANTATQVLKGVTNMLEDPDDAQVSTPAMPAGAMEGVHHAYASVSDGLANAKMAVVALPRVYQTKGVASVFKAVPQVILGPIIGTTDALTKLLYGVQHSLSRQDKNEFSDVYKQ